MLAKFHYIILPELNYITRIFYVTRIQLLNNMSTKQEIHE